MPPAAQRSRKWYSGPFLLWGWATLLVVLLSAAPSGGEVRFRLHGSAFDPSTVSVALGPKKPKARAVLARPDKGTPANHANSPPPIAVEAFAFGGAASLLPEALPPLIRRTPAHAGSATKAHGARAPPVA